MNTKQKMMLVRIALSLALLVTARFIPAPDGWPKLLLYLAPYLIIGWDVLYLAVSNILRGQVFDENFLMALATVGALVIGEYPEAAAVMLFYQVGELFQGYAVGKSRQSISQLMDIRPDYANIEEGGKLVQVDPEAVHVGDVFWVKPGEKVPLDGTVVDGNSQLDTAALTGESVPRTARTGDSVLSGCVNLSGLLRVRAEKAFHDSTVSRILDLVENASDKKARVENFITRFARVYTPIVVVSALLLAVVPPLFVGGWGEWVHRALIFLVISCPCALVISVPLSFYGGIGGASRRGILVKGGNYLEALSGAEIVVFDKTGTLTEGSFRVTAVHPEGISDAQLLEYTALAECFTDHPIAQSLRAAYGKPVDNARTADVRDLPGRGIKAMVDGKAVLCGNAKLMAENGVACEACELIGTACYVAVDGVYMGHILIADQIKPGAQQAIAALKGLGVRQTVMLTGDAAEVGQAVAKQVGIDQAFCQLMPQDKVEHVEALLGGKSAKGQLVFVGDGINDAPVLSRADVGVAMGALGSDAAIEAADIVLMDDKLAALPEAIGIAKRTLTIAKQNIVFALGVKAVVLLMGAFGVANLWEAVFADVGVSVIAILNAMRALRGARGNAGER